jgi:dephospho-CoA kinase
MEEKMAEHERLTPDKLLVVDIPLLYESGMEELFAACEIMVVYIPQELQLKRLMERDGLSADAALQRLAAQLPIEDKRQRADIAIDNGGALEATAEQIDQFMRWKGLMT